MKRKQGIIPGLNILTDLILINASYWLAVFLRFNYFGGYVSVDMLGKKFLLLVALYSVVLVLTFNFFNLYSYDPLRKNTKEYTTLFWLNVVGVLCLTALMFLLREIDVSRWTLAIFWFLSLILMLAKRMLGKLLFKKYLTNDKNLCHVIIIGNGRHAQRFAETVRENSAFGIVIDGYVSRVERDGLGKKLGAYEDLEEIIEKYPQDELIIALELHETDCMAMIMEAAGKEGSRVNLIPYYNDIFPAYPIVNSVGNTKLVDLRATPLNETRNAVFKRAFDLLASLLAVILLSPLLLITAIGVKLSSPGPVFFVQDRVGLNKKPFKMIKFRSMRVNAESDTAWSTGKDPRKTVFGSFIRKYSIDELPQLFNVIAGDMSLIGPRPEIPFYVAKFREDVPLYLVRQQVRPGMTGWAQVNGLRGDTSIEDRVRYDIWYIENWSISLDIKILFRTAFGGFINGEVTGDQNDQ